MFCNVCVGYVREVGSLSEKTLVKKVKKKPRQQPSLCDQKHDHTQGSRCITRFPAKPAAYYDLVVCDPRRSPWDPDRPIKKKHDIMSSFYVLSHLRGRRSGRRPVFLSPAIIVSHMYGKKK